MLTERGFTLTELLVGAALAAVVAIGIATLEGGRAKMEQEILDRSSLRSDESAIALALVGMSDRITQADRIVIDNGTGVFQFRAPVGCMAGVPAPACFDNPANYGWDQYRLTADQLQLYTATQVGCGNLQVLANNVTALSFNFIDFAIVPPGGNPVPDNNLVEYAVSWDNAMPGVRNKTHQFLGRAVSWNITYSNVNTTPTDSGTGMAPPGVANPPATCP